MTDGANINVGVSGETGATVSPDERERRQRVLKKAIASYNDQKITMECIVRDLSSSGVKLKLSNPLPLPDHFLLEIPMDGIVADCEVRWRRGDELGAVFIGDPRKAEHSHGMQKINLNSIAGLRRSVLRKPGM